MKKHRTARLRHRPLFVEGLETRAMLAGNVTASVRAGTLFVTGDNLANDVVIQQTGPNRFTVVGVAGSATKVNNKAEGVVFTGNGVRNFEIDLRAGNDTLGISNDLSYLDALSAELAAGPGGPVTASATTATALSLRGYANIRGGAGNDALAVNLLAGGAIFVDANAGSDAVVIEGSTAAALLVNTGTANQTTDAGDYLRIRNVAARGAITANTFSGDDVVLLTDASASTFAVNVGVGATTGTATDFDNLIVARLVSRGSVLLFAGAGDDAVGVNDVDGIFFLAVGGSGNDTMTFANLDVASASLIGETGDDSITVDDTIDPENPGVPILVDDTLNTEVTGLLHIDTGAGDDTVNVNGDVTFNPELGSLNILTLAGVDTVSASNLSLTGKAVIDLGTGEDSLTAGGIASDGDILLFGGTDNDIVAATGVIARFFLAVGGSGNDDMSFGGLNVANASLVGEVGNDTIILDDTLNALDPATPIVVDATTVTQVTDLLHIDSGAGDDTVSVNGDAAFNLSVGRLNVWTFGGIDTVTIANLTATGTINVDTADGNDSLTLDTVSTDGELNVFLGTGDDTVTATNVSAAGGARARYFGSLGDDTFTDGGGNGVEDEDYFLFDIENVL
ncbi:MAG: beta strand repeat-containing protein [Pirellulaceae bacterium]